LHISCIFHAYFVYILCILMHIMMHISHIFHIFLAYFRAYFLQMSCIFFAYSLHNPCIFLAYYLHIYYFHLHAKFSLICHLLWLLFPFHSFRDHVIAQVLTYHHLLPMPAPFLESHVAPWYNADSELME